jgi:hypothetical protein
VDLGDLEAALRADYLTRVTGQRTAQELLLSALARDDVVMNDPLLEDVRRQVVRGERGSSLRRQLRAAKGKIARGLWDEVSFENYRDARIQGVYDLLQALKGYESELDVG